LIGDRRCLLDVLLHASFEHGHAREHLVELRFGLHGAAHVVRRDPLVERVGFVEAGSGLVHACRDSVSELLRVAGQFLDLARDHGEATTRVAGACCLDGCVQREESCLPCDLLYTRHVGDDFVHAGGHVGEPMTHLDRVRTRLEQVLYEVLVT